MRETRDTDATDDIRRLALKLLGVREHSRWELSRKIQARGFTAEDALQVLDRLDQDGLLDEGRLAEQYVRERAEKGFGPLRIRAELREKGLAEAVIERYLDPMRDHWPGLLDSVRERRFGAARPSVDSERFKQARFLEQRGFPVELIRRHLRFHD